MKYIILICVLVLSFCSCQKTIERVQEEAVIDAVTNGSWLVTKLIKGNSDVTANFNAYTFKFNKNNTVDALQNNRLEQLGSWQTNTENRTITTQFINAVVPVSFLNGAWQITSSTWTTVKATKTIDGEVYQLELKKQ
jgi:hypothetical protein